MNPLSQLAEAKIDEAIAEGRLAPPPAGTELDLESYFAAPAEWRSTFAMLKGQGFVPPEVELLRRAADLEEELAGTSDPEERCRLRLQIESARTAFHMALDRFRRTEP